MSNVTNKPKNALSAIFGGLIEGTKNLLVQAAPAVNAVSKTQYELQVKLGGKLLGIKNVPEPVYYTKDARGNLVPNKSIAEYYAQVLDCIKSNPQIIPDVAGAFAQITGVPMPDYLTMSPKEIEWANYMREARACMEAKGYVKSNGMVINQAGVKQFCDDYIGGYPYALWGRGTPPGGMTFKPLPCMPTQNRTKFNFVLFIILVFLIRFIYKRIFKTKN